MCFTFFASSFTIAPFFALAKKPCMELIVIIEKKLKNWENKFSLNFDENGDWQISRISLNHVLNSNI